MKKLLLCLMAIIITVFTLNVSALAADTALSFVTEALPDAAANAYYEHQIEVTGGDGNYTFSTPDLADFPDGVTLSEDGLISGTPTVGEITYCNMTIVVIDGEGNSAERVFTLRISAIPVIVKIPQYTFEYDGQSHTVSVETYVLNKETETEEPVEGITCEITYSGQASQSLVGNYPIKIRITTPGYVLGSQDQKYMYIEQNQYTKISFEGDSFGYDGETKSPAISVKSRYTASSAEMDMDYTTLYEGINGTVYSDSSAPNMPGEYRVSCKVTNTNFATPAANSATFKILPVAVDFTLNDTSDHYVTDEWNRTYQPSVAAATDYTVTYSKGGVQYDKPSEVGVYTVGITFAQGSVYTAGQITPATVTVKQKPVNFTITNNTQKYSGTELYPKIENDCGLAVGEGYTVGYYKNENNTTPKDVGEYKIVINILNDNYVLGSQDQEYMYIEQNTYAEISFEGSSFIYDGEAKSPVISVKGKLTESDEPFDLAYTALYEGIGDIKYSDSAAPTQPGEYRVTCTVTDTNFETPSENSTTFEIVLTSAVDFDLNDKSDFYAADTWDRVYMPSVAEVTGYTVKYIKDDVPFDSPTEPGEYTVQITFAEGSAYTVGTITPSTVIALQKPVNFTVTNASQEYTGLALYPTIGNDCGLIENTDYTVEYYSNDSATTPVEAGEYTIIISVINKNYVYGGQDVTKFTITAPVDQTKFTLDDGNSIYARINADGGDIDAAKQSFEQNHTYNNIVYPPQAWGETNLDMDETAVFAYSGQDFELPAVTAVGSDGQPANVTAVIETGSGNIDLTGKDRYTANLSCGIYTIRYSIEGSTITGERKLVVLWPLGDANLDKNVNSIDGNYIKNIGEIPETTDNERLFKYRVCDVNHDGTVDSSDADAVYARFKQKITEYYR